jgi:hypothetical protein
MIETILAAVGDAFMSIGVFVLVLATGAALLRRRWGAQLADVLERHRKLGPLAGALVTMPPGCLGVLGVARLYNHGRVTYGTVLSAFLATMGDSAWLLWATHPVLTIKLKLGLSVLGAVSGQVVDALGARPLHHVVARPRVVARPAAGAPLEDAPVTSVRVLAAVDLDAIEAENSLTGAADAEGTKSASAAPVVPLFSVVAALGTLLALPVAFQVVDPEAIGPTVAGVNLYTAIGVLGFCLAAAVVWRSASGQRCSECVSTAAVRTNSSLEQGAREAAYVTVWSGLAFAAWELVNEASWTDLDAISMLDAAGIVVIAAVLGLVPACGVEIVVAGLFVAGGLPLPALVAYLVSEDGSGFVPLALRRPRAAALTAILTTIVAVIVGLLLYALL